MKSMISSLALVAAGLVGAQAANAGGYSPAVVETNVAVAPVVQTQIGNWQGAYAGATLGYGFGGDDRFGLTRNGVFLGDAGTAKLGGVNGGLQLGYRWQRDQWVFGPELSVEGGSIKDDFRYIDNGTNIKVESKLKSKVALKMKAGYEVQPDTLVYGVAGVANGKYAYTVGANKIDYKSNGYLFGLGVERKINERVSMFGEIERNAMKKETVTLAPGIVTEASPSYSNVKVGVNFKF